MITQAFKGGINPINKVLWGPIRSLFHQYPLAEGRFGKIVDYSKVYAGVQRICIELEGKPKEANEYSRKYAILVDSIADVLKNHLEIKPNEHERFITEIWGIIHGSLNIHYGDNFFGFLWESINTKAWDCDNSSFLVFDVGKKIWLDIKVISVPSHALIQVGSFCFETTSGSYYPFSQLKQFHPLVYGVISDVEKLQGIAYFQRAFARLNSDDYQGAIVDCDKAIELNPKNADTYYSRAFAKYMSEDYPGAIADYTKTIELDPKYVAAYCGRALAKHDSGDYPGAIADYTKAIELDPKDAYAYERRAYAKQLSKDYPGAIVDYEKALELDPTSMSARQYLRACQAIMSSN